MLVNKTVDKKRNEGNVCMIKKNIRFALLFFILTIGWKLIIQNNIKWGETISITILIFLFALLSDWANIPYKWKKQ